MPRSVLIVDDSAVMRHALSRLFSTTGDFAICGEASNGSQAIVLVGKLHPELIVLDLCMPGLNGLETARRLSSMGHHLPIILYSMNADEIVEKEAEACGVTAVVSKAEGIKTLIAKANGILEDDERNHGVA